MTGSTSPRDCWIATVSPTVASPGACQVSTPVYGSTTQSEPSEIEPVYSVHDIQQSSNAKIHQAYAHYYYASTSYNVMDQPTEMSPMGTAAARLCDNVWKPLRCKSLTVLQPSRHMKANALPGIQRVPTGLSLSCCLTCYAWDDSEVRHAKVGWNFLHAAGTKGHHARSVTPRFVKLATSSAGCWIDCFPWHDKSEWAKASFATLRVRLLLMAEGCYKSPSPESGRYLVSPASLS